MNVIRFWLMQCGNTRITYACFHNSSGYCTNFLEVLYELFFGSYHSRGGSLMPEYNAVKIRKRCIWTSETTSRKRRFTHNGDHIES